MWCGVVAHAELAPPICDNDDNSPEGDVDKVLISVDKGSISGVNVVDKYEVRTMKSEGKGGGVGFIYIGRGIIDGDMGWFSTKIVPFFYNFYGIIY